MLERLDRSSQSEWVAKQQPKATASNLKVSCKMSKDFVEMFSVRISKRINSPKGNCISFVQVWKRKLKPRPHLVTDKLLSRSQMVIVCLICEKDHEYVAPTYRRVVSDKTRPKIRENVYFKLLFVGWVWHGSTHKWEELTQGSPPKKGRR